MSYLDPWVEKIRNVRKKTVYRNFLKEVASSMPVVFHKNNGILSRYPDTKRVKKIIHQNDYEDYRLKLNADDGIEYDESIGLFGGIGIILKDFTYPALFEGLNRASENCNFTDLSGNSKSCYLSFVLSSCENTLFSFSVKDGTDVYNSIAVWNDNNTIYMSSGVITSYNIFFSKYIDNSSDIWFSRDLIGCSECLFCSDLNNLKYCINNKQLKKDEYLREKVKILKNKSQFLTYYKDIGLNSSVKNNNEFVVHSSNVENGSMIYHVNNARNVCFIGGKGTKEDMYDVFSGGATGDFCGTVHSVLQSEKVYIGVCISRSTNIFYSQYLSNCSFCIGCVGLKNKSYCILNKQYTKENWEKMANNIFTTMEEEGKLGKFFPAELNPFYFNDTMGSLLGDFSKEEIVKDGYLWRDDEIKVDIPEGSEIVLTSELNKYQGFSSEGKWRINPEILEKVIKDENGNYYRIVKLEYDFLMKHSLPLPEVHRMDRMRINFGV